MWGGQWICRACGEHNPPLNIRCQVCKRPIDKPARESAEKTLTKAKENAQKRHELDQLFRSIGENSGDYGD